MMSLCTETINLDWNDSSFFIYTHSVETRCYFYTLHFILGHWVNNMRSPWQVDEDIWTWSTIDSCFFYNRCGIVRIVVTYGYKQTSVHIDDMYFYNHISTIFPCSVQHSLFPLICKRSYIFNSNRSKIRCSLQCVFFLY